MLSRGETEWLSGGHWIVRRNPEIGVPSAECRPSAWKEQAARKMRCRAIPIAGAAVAILQELLRRSEMKLNGLHLLTAALICLEGTVAISLAQQGNARPSDRTDSPWLFVYP